MEKIGGAAPIVNPYANKSKDAAMAAGKQAEKNMAEKTKTDATTQSRTSGESASPGSSSSLSTPDLPKPKGDYSLDLSQKSKDLSRDLAKEVAKKQVVDELTEDDKKTKSKSENETKDLKKNELKNQDKLAPPLPGAKEVSKVDGDKKPLIEKPAIFFITGAEIFSGVSGGRYGGLRDMAEAVTGARHYAWDQRSEMLDEIKKRDEKQPVILVGHSFGGDTAFEIAEELNNLENKFRPIDLIVMVDSVGYDNDVIPQNVKKVLNFISDESSIFSDSPKIARNSEKTKVENFLRPEGHTELDDSVDIQSQILDAIKSAR